MADSADNPEIALQKKSRGELMRFSLNFARAHTHYRARRLRLACSFLGLQPELHEAPDGLGAGRLIVLPLYPLL